MQLTNWPNKWGNKSSLLFVRLFWWETAEEFELLKQNSIMDTFSQLCREEIWGIDVAFLNEQFAGKYKLTLPRGKER